MFWPQVLLVLAQCLPLWAESANWLAEGEQRRVPALGPAWVENGQILKVEQNAGTYVIHGLAPGNSDFRNGSQSSNFSVISRRQFQSFNAITRASAKSLGLSVEVGNQEVYVKGELIRFSDWKRLSTECENIHCQYLARFQVSPLVRKESQAFLSEQIRKISAFPYRLEFGENIRMFVPEKVSQLRRIQDLMSRYGIQVIADPSAVEILPMVKVQITIAEVKRNEMMKWGVQWPTSYQAQLIPGTDQATSPLTVALNAMESSGVGRVLASPNLLCRSGQEAEFTAGGEIPIKIINFKIQDIVWKRYGILLKVKPVADFSGRMSISVETEVSSLDDAHQVDGIPGVFTNRVRSHFDLTKPQTILLSGLLKKDSGENTSGIPGLQKIPILGSLFGSKDYRDSRTELMIFVRPEIVTEETTSN